MCTIRASLSQNTQLSFIIEQRRRLNRSDTLNQALAHVLTSCSFYDHKTLMRPHSFGEAFPSHAPLSRLPPARLATVHSSRARCCWPVLLSFKINNSDNEMQLSHFHPSSVSKFGPLADGWTILERSSHNFGDGTLTCFYFPS